jgi:HNH endonuclease
MCYSRGHRAGEFNRQRENARETFDKSYVKDPITGCWNWTAGLLATGYGQIYNDEGKHERAHRFSFRTLKAAIPKNLLILHQCDNRRCVNPDHLHLGTHSENLVEAYQRGKSPPRRKLTDEQVRQVRKMHGSMLQKQLAVHFGVSESIISNIINRRIWRRVK